MNKINCPNLSVTVRKAILFWRISEKPNKKSPTDITTEDFLFLLALLAGAWLRIGTLAVGLVFLF